MRQLIIRGNYRPSGVSGQSLMEALKSLNPEIYGSINDPEKVELDGLLYVAERLPRGIEECRFVQLGAREGLVEAGHEVIVPLKRRRNCFRIDDNRMYVEMSRGRSDINDILTHLTFLYIEAEKIKRKSLDRKGQVSDNWLRLEEVVQGEEGQIDEKRALVYLSNALGRTVSETHVAVKKFAASEGCNSLYHLVYWMGQIAIEEDKYGQRKQVSFSAKLRDVIGHHVYGEQWASDIKRYLADRGWLERELHVISANLHSVVHSLYGRQALPEKEFESLIDLARNTSENRDTSARIRKFAREHGLHELDDRSGTNLDVQVIELEKWQQSGEGFIEGSTAAKRGAILLVMDYAFGEQAFECMDELLKPYSGRKKEINLNLKTVSIMGKAGILDGAKGDIMLPTAHIFEGTADNYPFDNELTVADFEGSELAVYEGPMFTVLGTSLQNRDVLHHFRTSTWNAVGIEMEGAHYQKAIQSAARIRKSIDPNIRVLYAYYASDNPLITGSTLSSGSLGREGVKPTYWITQKILERVLGQ